MGFRTGGMKINACDKNPAANGFVSLGFCRLSAVPLNDVTE